MSNPYSSFETIIQYCYEHGTSSYGKIPTSGTTTLTQVPFSRTTGDGMFMFGVLPDANPDINPNRYMIEGIGVQGPRYSRLGSRAVKYDFTVYPCDIPGTYQAAPTYDATYLQSHQNIIDLLCLAMGTSTNTTDNPAASQWGTSAAWHYPYLRNHVPSIGIEQLTQRAGSTSAGLWEFFCGLQCSKLSMEAKLNEPFKATVGLIGQDVIPCDPATYSDTAKTYTHDTDGTAFGSGGFFGNTITSNTPTSFISATNAVMPARAPYMYYEGGIKYQYVSNYTAGTTGTGYDASTANLNAGTNGCHGWTSPDNIVGWKFDIDRAYKPQYGICASGQKFLNYLIPGQRTIKLDITANFDSVAHYKDMMVDNQILYVKLRMGTSGYALLFRNGHPITVSKKFSKAELIAMPVSCNFEQQNSPNTYLEWVAW